MGNSLILQQIWSKLFNKSSFSRDDTFSSLKGNSKLADELFHLLEEAFGKELHISPTIAYDYPTIEKQLAYINELIAGKNAHPRKTYKNRKPSEFNEPIAIIGISFRFPGGVNTPDAFWELLINGKDALEEIPLSRWNIDEYYDSERKAPGKMVCRKGGFITDHDKFDAEFFKISPIEAEFLDPNQRIALETTWHALEDAGISPKSLIDSATGVFFGVMFHDYEVLLELANLKNERTGYLNSGTSQGAVAGRISYSLGLRGPAMVIDTACSSSLTAIHEACQHLRTGECDLALAGGVNLMLLPEVSVSFSQANMLSPDGSCKSFSDDANGYVRSEGCGVVVLKKLSDAQKNGDRILAVIKGSAINQDGASGGMTVPSRLAQQELLQNALLSAQLKPCDIDYIEAHGTGTPLGDPIEIGAIEQIYQGRDRPLYIGSVKSNIGHLEAAAGVAGLIKVVLSLQEECIPANLHFNKLNPRIHLDSIPACIPLTSVAWLKTGKRRCAGVSSFGFIGTNVHAILEQAPLAEPRNQDIELPKEYPFILSAKKKDPLLKLIGEYQNYLEVTQDRIEDICYTLAVGRSHFNYRCALSVSSIEDLKEQLSSPELMICEVLSKDILCFAQNTKEIIDAYLNGEEVNWTQYYTPYVTALRKVSLPTYQFDPQRYWFKTQKKHTLSYGASVHELLGARLPGYGDEIRFLNVLDVCNQYYLASHQVFHEVILPGSGFVESALAAGQLLKGRLPISLKELSLLKPLRLASGSQYDYQVSVTPSESGYEGRVDAHDQKEGAWVEYATFNLSLDAQTQYRVVDIEQIKSNKTEQDVKEVYAQLEALGLNYGAEFQVISEAYLGSGNALIAVTLQEGVNASGYCMHPTLLDGAFQVIALLASTTRTYIPAMLDSLVCYQPFGTRVWIEARLIEEDGHALKADISIYDEHGVVLTDIEGFRARATDKQHVLQLIHESHAADIYIEGLEAYTLPDVLASKGHIKVYADEVMSDSPTHWEYSEDTNWSAHHVLVVYSGNLPGLVLLAQHALKTPPLSLTLLVAHAFSLADEVINPESREALGFWRTFVQEVGSTVPCYFIDSTSLPQTTRVMDLIVAGALPEPEIIVRGTETYVPRLYREKEALRRAHQLPTPQPAQYLASNGGIDTLYWAIRPEEELGANQIRVRIEATSLNFRDVLNAMDLYPGDAGKLGCECAGIVLAVGAEVKQFTKGNLVVVFGQGLFGAEVVVDAVQACALPQILSPAEGAAIPIVFLTANYGLNHLAQLQRGQKVLIHAASGGVGLAAIALAKLVGAQVYATASTTKQAYLRDMLGIEHVYDSRSTDFGAQILTDTEGSGVDVVLNSLTSEGFIAASLSCLKEGGVFLEIGKLNIYSKEQMYEARPDVHYHIIAIDTRMEQEPVAVLEELDAILALFAQGQLKALLIKEFAIKDTISAFQYLQKAQHIGKVVICAPEPFVYKADATYLITGGTGGLGLQLAHHLIEHGARHLVLTSRSAASAPLTEWINEQKQVGIEVRHESVDVADEKALGKVFAAIKKGKHPLKGIFHVAGLLRDGMLINLSEEDFDVVLAPKILGSHYLDKLSRSEKLDCFVLFSSVTSLLGNLGQTNYTAANAYMDGLAHARRQQGLPALSINWGPFATVGMATNLTQAHSTQGMLPLETTSSFVLMDRLITQAPAQVGLMRMDWNKVPGQGTPYLSYLTNAPITNDGEWCRLLDATPAEQREQVLTGQFKRLVADVLHIQDINHIDTNKGFFEMGVDSLTAVELKNKLQHFVGAKLKLNNTIFFEKNNIQEVCVFLVTSIYSLINKKINYTDKDSLPALKERIRSRLKGMTDD